MDEETAIINSNTRNEKIRNFFVNNKKILITILLAILILLIGYFTLAEYKKKQKLKISNQYNSIVTEYSKKNKNKEQIKNSLIDLIYKKALYNADKINENELIEILKPIINSDSVWKSQSLYLLAEYFYSKGEKQKSKEFFNQILLLENVNQDLKIEAQKRLNRDLSE